MLKRLIIPVLAVIALLLSACAAAPEPVEPATPTAELPLPAPDDGYPAPSEEEAVELDPMTGGYPGPSDETLPQEEQGLMMNNAYPPADSDAGLDRGNFFLDAATLQPVADAPGTAELYVEGSLPTPCNELRVQINPPDANNRIVVELYSVSDPNLMCVQKIEPFTGKVATLSGYPSGTYTVVAGEQTVGELVVP